MTCYWDQSHIIDHYSCLATSVLLRIVDYKTSYNMLLGRPWLHDNGVVPSALHQYFKYVSNEAVKKVVANDKPFMEDEAYITNTKLYSQDKATILFNEQLIRNNVSEK